MAQTPNGFLLVVATIEFYFRYEIKWKWLISISGEQVLLRQK